MTVVRGGAGELGDCFEGRPQVPANPTRASYPSLTQFRGGDDRLLTVRQLASGVRMFSLDYMKPRVEHLEGRPTDTTVVIEPRPCDNNTDDVLVDASPFDLIYDTYAPLLRKIACAKFGISTNDAADLVHDVFATYLVNPARVEALRPYLIGAICNASRSYLRRMSVRDTNCSSLDACIAGDDDVLEAVSRDMLIGRILGRLGSSCRDALHRFYIHGDTAAAIAERRNTSSSYIGRLLHFCRKRARDAYNAIEKGEL